MKISPLSSWVSLASGSSLPDGVGLTLVFLGSVAPQGLSSRQEDAQALSPLHFSTHWLPHSWQTKYGRVRLYSVTLGRLLLPQRHP